LRPVPAGEQRAAARGAEIGISDRQRQLSEERAQRIGAEPHAGQPEREICQAVRNDRHEPQDRDHAPAAPLGALQQSRRTPPPGPLGEAGAEIARHEKPGDRAKEAAERRPERAPPHPEDEPRAERQ